MAPSRRSAQPIVFAFVLALIAGCPDNGTKTPDTSNYGKFVGRLKVELLDGGREIQLLEDYGYVDPRDKLWTAPAGSIVDGASIPQAFWTVIGGPLEGKYRNASVLHDVECERMQEPWEAVHKMFYEACLCAGVESWRAKTMYLAVEKFGPRWKTVTITRRLESERKPDPGAYELPPMEIVTETVPIPPPPPPSEDEVRKLAEYVRREDPSLDELERLDVAALLGRPAPPDQSEQ